jgi:hypothetical protein
MSSFEESVSAHSDTAEAAGNAAYRRVEHEKHMLTIKKAIAINVFRLFIIYIIPFTGAKVRIYIG